jgi:DNA-binding response OmpR family regulator
VTAVPIFIVEDDDNIAELLAFMFRREGFAPVVLRDGRAAQEHVVSQPPPAAAVLDVMLPYRDGFAVATAIRSHPRWKHVPIVMLSARALPSDLERGRGLGVADFVLKPFQPGALVGRLKDLVWPATA